MPSTASNSRNGGRICAFQRNTNNAVTTVGATLATPANLPVKYDETAQFTMSNKCRRNYYCQQLAQIIRILKAEDPAYYEVGVQKVRVDDLNDPTKYFFYQHFKENLVYAGLNKQFVLHFLVSTKEKEFF